MPRRDDIRTILIIGSGPIVIGQGCEFDYSGAQACKSLRDEGYRVVLVNSNPATIMTDPAFADRTYIEPVTPDAVRKIIEKEATAGTPIDAILPTLGGQTGLNCACALYDSGVLAEFGIEMIGADREAISRAEDREEFAQVCAAAKLATPESKTITTLADGRAYLETIGLPAIIRPAFTLGGWGGGIAYNLEEFDELVTRGIRASMIGQVQVDKSLLGWKEYELEVIRDKADNFAVICTIENFDPMGVHTGDSVTVAPAMTLTDREYQRMRDAGRKIITEIGVDTGGSNIQFAVDPETGRLIVIEMNPRVSRSSALASKATGYPIAKVAAKLAVGYTLDELRNDITGTSSAFEPTIDYVVTKWPRFAFEKFRGSDPRLTTQMKSVGEAMAIGKTFKESVQKAARSLEVGRDGLVSLLEKIDYRELRDQVRRLAKDPSAGLHLMPLTEPLEVSRAELQEAILEVVKTPLSDRLWYICDGLRVGLSIEQLQEATGVDSWFLDQLEQIVSEEEVIRGAETLEAAQLDRWKRMGFSDARIAQLRGAEVEEVRRARSEEKVEPIYARVDTCAAEFAALTPYLYSTWGERSESEPTGRKKVMILGGGPNRIGQGIEFD
ncbi:MAG TPA: carbamoyl phosphate synthase large subunit, partial [Tistrella mobilis]|nr:carbamoyl phosphate synthase large subunit [Tistrella mobilis]